MLTALNPETLGYIFRGDFLAFAANINNGERIPAVVREARPVGPGRKLPGLDRYGWIRQGPPMGSAELHPTAHSLLCQTLCPPSLFPERQALHKVPSGWEGSAGQHQRQKLRRVLGTQFSPVVRFLFRMHKSCLPNRTGNFLGVRSAFQAAGLRELGSHLWHLIFTERK